jgi:hypothetical protein
MFDGIAAYFFPSPLEGEGKEARGDGCEYHFL